MRLMLCLHRHFAQLGWPVASAATLTAFRLSQQEKTAAGNFYRFLDGKDNIQHQVIYTTRAIW